MVRGVRVPTWEYLHESYCQLELCQILGLFLDWMKKQPKGKSVTATKQRPEVDRLELSNKMTDKLWDLLGAERDSSATVEKPDAPAKGNRSTEAVTDSTTGSATEPEAKSDGVVVLDQHTQQNL